MYNNQSLLQDIKLKRLPLTIFDNFVQTLQKHLQTTPITVPGLGIFQPPNFHLLLLQNYKSNFSTITGQNTARIAVTSQILQILTSAAQRQNVEIKFKNIGKLWINKSSKTYGFEYAESSLRSKSCLIYGTEKLEKDRIQREKEEFERPVNYKKSPFSSNYQPQQEQKRSLSCKIQLQNQSQKMRTINPKFDITLDDTKQKCYLESLQQLRQCDYEYDQVCQAVRNEIQDTIQNQTLDLNKQQLLESKKFVKKSNSCISCCYEKDIKDKTFRAKQMKALEQNEFNDQHSKDFYWYKQRELHDQKHFRQQQEIMHQYNEKNAKKQQDRSRSYRQTGRFNPQGLLQENTAILQDKHDLQQTMRKRAQQYLKDQLLDQSIKDMKIQQKQEFQEDYINRKHLEESVKKEIISDLKFKKLQQNILGNYLSERLQTSQVLPIQKIRENNTVANQKEQDRILQQFSANTKSTAQYNQNNATLTNKNRSLSVQNQRVQEKQSIQNNINERIQQNCNLQIKKQQTRQDLIQTYNKDIRAKSQQRTSDRVNSWQDMTKYRFNTKEYIQQYDCGCAK